MKQVIKIWAVALIVTICGLFYVNASMNAIEIESDIVGATEAPQLTSNVDTALYVDDYQPTIDAYDLQSASNLIQ